MKTSIATTISISAVLVAGGVAFAVNSRALDSTNITDGSVPTVEVMSLSVDPTDMAAALTPSTVVPSVVGSAATTSSLAPVADELNEYELAGIGVVTLQSVGEDLKVFSVTPEAGFTFSSTQVDMSQVRVELQSATQKVEFRARMIDGRIVTDVKSSAIGGRNSSGDDHDEEHEEDEKNEEDEKHEEEDEHEGEEDDD